jgi:hypothetical protein
VNAERKSSLNIIYFQMSLWGGADKPMSFPCPPVSPNSCTPEFILPWVCPWGHLTTSQNGFQKLLLWTKELVMIVQEQSQINVSANITGIFPLDWCILSQPIWQHLCSAIAPDCVAYSSSLQVPMDSTEARSLTGKQNSLCPACFPDRVDLA